jgi:predicted nucleotidyltransferase
MAFEPQALPEEIRTEAARRIAEIEAEHGVRVVLAVESGSRAWGFPSPDSDYDVRFLYVRPLEDYLRLEPPRDVIETPIDGLWDVNGWDLKKGLQLLRKGNAVVLEWLRSPLVYVEAGDTPERLRALTQDFIGVPDAVRHYHGLARSMYGRDIEGRQTVRLKKYFYSLRAAVALGWVRRFNAVPPMALPELVEGDWLETDVRAAIDSLLDAKSGTKELGEGPRLPVLDRFIEGQIGWGQRSGLLNGPGPTEEFDEAADRLFRETVVPRPAKRKR